MSDVNPIQPGDIPQSNPNDATPPGATDPVVLDYRTPTAPESAGRKAFKTLRWAALGLFLFLGLASLFTPNLCRGDSHSRHRALGDRAMEIEQAIAENR